MPGSGSRVAGICLACAVIASEPFGDQPGPESSPARRMSFHNRLLLNRAAVSGLSTLELLLLTATADRPLPDPAASARVGEKVVALGGRVLRTEPALGYLRVEIPIDRLLELTESDDVAAYQISSLSRGAWYRDGPPMSNAQMFRGFEVAPIAAVGPAREDGDLPVLTPDAARSPGFTGDDAGVGEWLVHHPTFDGRGVTIALLESALPAFLDPALQAAKTLDGREIPKIAGILNVVDAARADETRVALNTTLDAPTSWARFGSRTYILPRPGRYRIGLVEVPAGGNVIHQFGVVEDDVTAEVWIDANGNASFQDETPLADVNERFDPRTLSITYPRKVSAGFVMARGRTPHLVHIYIGRSSHQTMTASVAAGARTADGFASGVAPGARVLLVRMQSNDTGLGDIFEAFIEAARRPEIDVINVSGGLTIVPDTAADFAGSLFSRLVAAYQKPIINAAGNTSLILGSAHGYGAMLSTGGILPPATYAALYGGRPLDRVIVHPISGAGPALDGAIKPDFVAPMERLATDLPWNTGIAAVPRSAPTHRLPAGYQVSCCTSATSPYAAGIAALLISAAKQSRVAFSADRLGDAMRTSARLVAGYQPHQQGNGALNVSAAWRALQTASDPPRIVASARIVHPLAQYSARGDTGSGILEFEGWSAGIRGVREIRLQRQSGPPDPATYRVSWAGNDGTFAAPPTVTLPLGTTVPLEITVNPHSPGAHSALLDLRDPETNALVFRTQATIVASESLEAATPLHLHGIVGLMRQTAHYVHIPPAAGALSIELEVHRGVVQPTILQSHGLSGDYYMHVHPMNTFFVGRGRYHVIMPNPKPGTWTFRFDNKSVWFNLAPSFGPRDDSDAEYTLTLRLLGATVRSASTDRGAVVDLANTGDTIGAPMVEAWSGSLKSHSGTFPRSGLPRVIDIDVPPDAGSLSLRLRSESSPTNVELYLYDCTTGECFSYDIAFPAARSQSIVVRKPAAGRWRAAMNAAPFATGGGAFALDEIITTGTPIRRAAAIPRRHGERWRETFEQLPAAAPLVSGRTAIVLFQLLDAAAERSERDHPWSTAPHYVTLRDRPVAIGTAVSVR